LLQLAKRAARKREAEAGLEEAKEAGGQEEALKFAKRSVRVTKEHNEECKKLLRLMGVPVVEVSPSYPKRNKAKGLKLTAII
jgi:flap endonuclease-1